MAAKKKKRNKPRHNFNIEPKTPRQAKLIESIQNNTVTFCNGLAGSGKTLISIGLALKLYHSDPQYERIIVVRPAIEACGEKIGYLPGDINDKMKPLIQPIVDNLRFFLKDSGYISFLLGEEGPIEVIPMGYLRGRTLNNCIVIFDEAQNANWKQMKLFLTRLGHNCKAIVEGDATQSDLPFKERESGNGLSLAIQKLRGLQDIGIVRLEAKDVVRSEIVARILRRLGEDEM